MKRITARFSIMLSSILFAASLLSSPAFAQDRPAHPPPTAEESTRYGWATVLRSDPVYAQADEPGAAQEVCNEPMSSPPPPRDEPAHSDSRAGGTVVGAIIGGVIGSMFGKGDGHKVATAGGVVAGAVIGNHVAAANEARADAEAGIDAPPPPAERRCEKAESSKRIVAYDVEYRYAGELYMARLAYDPGDRMRVKISVVPAD
ncbi:MAG: glycine zipper 2TM domain-containing protein [Gammaproteobacteria bacterium]|nr:MAG: glycine zipper 2TM domain-containing protein [Gammaproteobacteria bacterium]